MNHAPSPWDHCLAHDVRSDVGMRRANNQDNFAVAIAGGSDQFARRGHLFLVADGMGAHAAGELASKIVADNVPLVYLKSNDLPASDALKKAIEESNDLIYRRGQSSDDFRGMGTTATSMALLPEGALVGQVGDSRAYRLRGTTLEQLTRDHSLVWEMRAQGQLPADQPGMYVPKNIITRSLGPNPHVQVDLEGPFPLAVGDTFLLCSDGLTGPVNDKELGQILACFAPNRATQLLVDLANLRGGPDNITLIVVKVLGPQTPRGGAPAPAPTGDDVESPSISPVYWALIAGFAVLGVLALVLQHLVVGVAGLLAAAITGLIAVLTRPKPAAPGQKPVPVVTGPLGKGPYVRCDATPDSQFGERLASIVQELRDAAVQGAWAVDWARFNQYQSQGDAGMRSSNWSAAVVAYGEAIMFLMAQLRSQRSPH